jgi:hypothetical protein
MSDVTLPLWVGISVSAHIGQTKNTVKSIWEAELTAASDVHMLIMFK